MLRLLQCECIKLKRSKFLLIGILGTLIVPFFVIVNAVTKYLSNPEHAISVFSLYDNALMFLMLLFAPMVLTILGAWIISHEYTDGTLKNIFVIPVSQTAFLCGKILFFAIAAILLINVVLSSSPIAGFYPWSSSYLLVMGRLSRQGCPWGISVSIILMMSLSGIAASLFRFKKEEV